MITDDSNINLRPPHDMHTLMCAHTHMHAHICTHMHVCPLHTNRKWEKIYPGSYHENSVQPLGHDCYHASLEHHKQVLVYLIQEQVQVARIRRNA